MKRIAMTALMLLIAAVAFVACGANNKPDISTTSPEETIAASGAETTKTEEIMLNETTTPEVTTTPEETTEPQPPEPTPSDKLAEILRSSQTLQSESVVLAKIPNITSKSNPSLALTNKQGGYTDGKYFYQVFMKTETDQNNNTVRIVKYDLERNRVRAISGDLSTNHSNDIAYNPNINKFIIVHNAPNRNLISFLDPDTLEVVETKDLGFTIYCLDYDATHNQYVIGHSGGQCFQLLDENFNLIGRKAFVPTRRSVGYVTQGCSCDENFIYFVLYKENCITVYDWEGSFVTYIEIDVGNIEPENISVVDGRIYVGCGGGDGATVFEIIPKMAE